MTNKDKAENRATPDPKARFREALERKNKRSQEREPHQDFVPNINAPHGLAAHKRTFRRKTG
jgi:hypothetical protein